MTRAPKTPKVLSRTKLGAAVDRMGELKAEIAELDQEYKALSKDVEHTLEVETDYDNAFQGDLFETLRYPETTTRRLDTEACEALILRAVKRKRDRERFYVTSTRKAFVKVSARKTD